MEKNVLHVEVQNHLTLAHSADSERAREHVDMDVLGRVGPGGTMLGEIMLHMTVVLMRGSVVIDVRRGLEPQVTQVEVDGRDVHAEDLIDRERVLADGGVVNVS